MLIVGYSRTAAAKPAGLRVANFTAHTDLSQNTTAELPIPAGVSAGSTLVAVLRLVVWNRVVPSITPPAGWTLVAEDKESGLYEGLYVYRKTASAGDAGSTASWTTLGSNYKSAFIFAEVAEANGTVSASFARDLNPPAHTLAGGALDTVWIAVTTSLRNDNAVTASPAGYTASFVTAETSTTNVASGGECTIGGAHRQATAASEDPGAFAWSGVAGPTTSPQSCTISVR